MTRASSGCYVDTLYNNQGGENVGAFSDAKLEKFAQQVGLDMDKSRTCMSDHTHLAKIQTSTQNGSRAASIALPRCSSTGSWCAVRLHWQNSNRSLELCSASNQDEGLIEVKLVGPVHFSPLRTSCLVF